MLDDLFKRSIFLKVAIFPSYAQSEGKIVAVSNPVFMLTMFLI